MFALLCVWLRTYAFVHLNGVVVIDLGGLVTGRRVGVVECIIRGWGAYRDTRVSFTHQKSETQKCRGVWLLFIYLF
jgi:hypothetical protein